MALGALISAYREDDSGGLRALLPLAGRTLIEYQARCAAAAGAAPILVLVERVPQALEQAFDRLRGEGIAVVPVSNAAEAAARFEAGALVLHLADGLAAEMRLVRRIVQTGEPAIATVPDDPPHEAFERIDAATRWAGLALVEARLLGSTAAMLGDWDLESTLLRRTVQEGALRLAVDQQATVLLVTAADQTSGFERRLLVASRGERRDWPSRFLLPMIEEFATERLMPTRVQPALLVQAALGLALIAAFCFTRGWLWPALGLLLAASPLDPIADRLATLRLRPLPTQMLARRLLWPANGLALLALGWFEARHGGGWGAMVAAFAAFAFAQAAVLERTGALPQSVLERAAGRLSGEVWLFSARGAVWSYVPFALAGWWNGALAALAAWAAISFFIIQHACHQPRRD